MPAQLDGTVLTRDEHACTASAAETTGAPVMLAEGSVNIFGPFAMFVGGVVFVTHDTGGGDINTGTTGTCEGCLVDTSCFLITLLWEGGDVLGFLGVVALGDDLLKPVTECLTALPLTKFGGTGHFNTCEFAVSTFQWVLHLSFWHLYSRMGFYVMISC